MSPAECHCLQDTRTFTPFFYKTTPLEATPGEN